VEAPAPLDIHLLGGFRVVIDGNAMPDGAWRQKRAAAIVKLLALEPTHRLHRDHVTETLWPDVDPDVAANNLRVFLHYARRGLEAAGAPRATFLVRDGEDLLLGPSQLVRVDVDLFEVALDRAWRRSDPGAAQAALDRYHGDLLPEDPYEDWLADRRATLRTSYLTLLSRLAQLHEQRSEFGEAINALQRLLATEPLDEVAHTTLIRLLALTGRRRQALQQYNTLVVLLDRELGVEPEPATRELIGAIRDGRFPAATQPLEPAATIAHPTPAPRLRGLPAPVDDVIGREREEAELRRLLATTRLVTLTGPGGVGKTRLAVALAHAAATAFPDGAHVVDLAPIDEPALVLPEIARALGVRDVARQPLLETVKQQLGEQRVLLVVDNMERVASAAPVIAELLASCPYLKALITSRIRLRLRGEQEYPVQPLALPDVHATSGDEREYALPATSLTDVPAVALFVRRARAARPDFALTEANAAAVIAICRRLDGLPLAIELGAARVRLLPPSELAERLERPLEVLTGGPRDAPNRQQTLRATIAWSYDLLNPEEQVLFACLSVFAGGCTLEAIETLVGDLDSDAGAGLWASSSDRWVVTSGHSVFDLVASLVDQSLLRQTEGTLGTPRLSMLETIREYAREQLETSGEAEAVRHRHAAHFLALAEAAAPELTGPDQGIWLDRLESEHDNFRRALTTFQEAGDAVAQLRLAGALWRFWWQRGFLSEGRRWLERALADGAGVEIPIHATALDGAGALAEAQGDLSMAIVHHEAALNLWRQIGDQRGVARSLTDLGIVADKMGDPERATQLYEDALVLAREEDDRPRIAACLANLGFVSLDQGNHQRAAACFKESLGLFRDLEDQRNLSYVLGGLGGLAFLEGDYRGAVAIQEEVLRHLRELGDRQGIADTLADLGHAVQRQGDLDRAWELYSQGLDLYRDLADPSGAAFVLTHLGRLAHLRGDAARAETLLHESLEAGWRLGEKATVTEAIEGLAGVACDRGEATQCARLLGIAEALRETTGIPLPAVHEPEIERYVTTARAALGEASFAAARGEGRSLGPEHAVAVLAGHAG
jgi:predicted ATPase/DNA-binding SARP family transcriptional activator